MNTALAAAPERVDDPNCPYDPNDADSVASVFALTAVRLLAS